MFDFKVAFLDSNMPEEDGFYKNYIYKDIFKRIDIYNDFESIFDEKVLLLPMCCDELQLLKHQELLKNFIKEKKILISFYPFLHDVISPNFIYYPSEKSIKDRQVFICDEVLSGVNDYDINYRRGVKGFFNRGYVNPMPNARIWIKDCDDRVVCYSADYQNSHVIVSAGACLFWYGLFENNTARRLGPKTLKYIDEKLKDMK